MICLVYIVIFNKLFFYYIICSYLNSRRIDDDRGKSHELGQSTVKCMRGILECWIKQAARVEAFKTRQSAAHALHVKFHLTTGEPVLTDDQYHHLQIDVVSLYLIFLVQMITSGLQIIYTQVLICIIFMCSCSLVRSGAKRIYKFGYRMK